MIYCTHGITKAVAEGIKSNIMSIKTTSGRLSQHRILQNLRVVFLRWIRSRTTIVLDGPVAISPATVWRDRFPSVTATMDGRMGICVYQLMLIQSLESVMVPFDFSVSSGTFDDTPSRILHMSPNC